MREFDDPQGGFEKLAEQVVSDLVGYNEIFEIASRWRAEDEPIESKALWESVEGAIPQYKNAAKILSNPLYEEKQEYREIVEKTETYLEEFSQSMGFEFEGESF